jgi:hypothetical protein
MMPARRQGRLSLGAFSSTVLAVTFTIGAVGAGVPINQHPVARSVRTCGWKVVSSSQVNAAERHGTLVGVTVLSARDVWTVGNSTEHWNGASWTVYKPVRTESDQRLEAIAAISSKDVFVVGGDSYFSGEGRALIDRWNGVRWRKVFSPITNARFSPKTDLLHAVSGLSARDVWAAGGQPVSDGQDRAYVLHWNGRKWIGMAPPVGDAYPDELYGIAPVSSRYVLVVGNNGYAALWNGNQWTMVDSPVYANAITALSKDDAWAVGYGNAGVIEHWNGLKWSPSPLTLPAGWSADLESVSAAGPDDVWAVGQAFRVTSTHQVLRRRALVVHWSGTGWSTGSSPSLHAVFSELAGVAMLANGDAWAVGRYGKGPSYGQLRPLLEHYTHC